MGQTGDAVAELNKIRNRAGLKNYEGATDQQSVQLEILDERAREFWIENKRWPDLLRFHHAGVIDVYEVVPNLKAKKDNGLVIPLYFALPVNEMALNLELVQTEGYENL